ncbi:hypothetical protein WJX72_003588 [[Myrmecia] bisecta]|uniref:Kinesin-like protein n=1 Tax=[Myrmecia] bisecta TaxID=41462 RepID=A0AAW1PE19_9CHLO
METALASVRAADGARSEAEQSIAPLQQELAELGARLSEQQNLRENWELQYRELQSAHNQVKKEHSKLVRDMLELKGNIRVLCRVRPMTAQETGALKNHPAPIYVRDTEAITLTEKTSRHMFAFDRVFLPHEGQQDVFKEVGAAVASILEGYNVCIMAYGQTGSGKTYTICGPPGEPGVNRRALQELFSCAAELASTHEVQFNASILEIYNETIRDLLSPVADQKLEVKENPDGSMYVPGLTLQTLDSMATVEALVQKGAANRAVSATRMNEHSSRSHLVFTVYVACKDNTTGTVARGKLHLVDLAGSERLSRSLVEGDRLKETQAINKSLAALGGVMQALQAKLPHVPYRNSRLTRLLEDSLGGHGRVIMIVACSPALEDAGETRCTLEFGERVRKAELGQAKRHISTGRPSN